METKILVFLREKGSASPSQIGEALGLSEKSIFSMVQRLADKGAIEITEVRAADRDGKAGK